MGERAIAGRHRYRNADSCVCADDFIMGGVGQLIWSKVNHKTEDSYRIPLASGLIAGEALLAVVLAILAAIGWMKP